MSDSGPPGTSFDNWAYPPQPPASSWPTPPTPTPPKRASRALTLGAAIAATVLVGAAGGIAVAFLTRAHQAVTPGTGGVPTPFPTNPADPSAAAAVSAYQAALGVMASAHGFHYVLTATGPVVQTFVGDATPSGGRQAITFNSSFGVETFNLVLVSGTVYFQGNVPALEDQLGVPAAKAPPLVNKWVSVLTGNGPYSQMEQGITVADQKVEVPMVPTGTKQVLMAPGTVTQIIGTIPQASGPAATAFLDVQPSTNIPVAYGSTLSAGGVVETTHMTFSQWGTAATITAPTGAVAWSTLGASAPPGGYGQGGATSSGPTPTPTGAI